MISVKRFSKLGSILAASAVTVGMLAPPAGAEPTIPEKEAVAVGTGGAIATLDEYATEAGLAVLRDGGNAVDAAVAAAAVLGVTEPFSCGLGGGGFFVIYNAEDGKVSTIDHREKAPSAMTADAFWEDGEPLPFREARYNGMSAGVPGTVAGWAEAVERFGTRSLSELMQPAIDIARDGFVVDETFASMTEANRPYFDDLTSSAETFLRPDGSAPEVGSTFRNPDVAKTFERIAKHGPKGFYRGPIAAAMADAVQNPPVTEDADHTWRPGLMTTKDVRSYTVDNREPTKIGYRGLDVYGMAPPSSGGSTVGEALNILEGFDLGAMPRSEAMHYYLESSRYAFADRNAYLGDADFVDVPLRGLLSDDFAAERRALITDQAAPGAVEPGDPWPHNGGGSGSPGVQAADDGGRSTAHLTVADAEGNVVSYTFTIESTGGNGITVPGWGFLLNNELTDFSYHLLDHPNSVEGGKRPRSSMSPTIVLEDGEPTVAVGTPGGTRIITTVEQILVEHLDLGQSLPDALHAPRASQRNGSTTLAEREFINGPDGAELVERGHVFSPTTYISAATGIDFLPDGRMVAVAEKPNRRGGGAAGVVDPE